MKETSSDSNEPATELDVIPNTSSETKDVVAPTSNVHSGPKSFEATGKTNMKDVDQPTNGDTLHGLDASEGTNDQDEDSIKSTEAILDGYKAEANEDQGHHETSPPDSLEDERLEKPELDRFMASCQKGDLNTVEELISNDTIKATEAFSDGITGLHWAAINNHLPVVRFLCENVTSKADPNAAGGELRATPLHWACRNGLVYVVDYLLQHANADVSLRDAQSYNALHLAVHSSNIMLIIYLVYNYCGNSQSRGEGLYIDEPDAFDRTPLCWASYQGDILTVNLLLKFGADVKKRDKTLFIPLHWAFMKGYKSVLKALVNAGSDIFAKNDQGKNSFDVAKDMNCYSLWMKVLQETGRDPKHGWELKKQIIDPKHGKLVTFLAPYLFLALIFNVCSFHNGLFLPKLLAGISIFVGSIFLISKIVIPTYLIDDNAVAKSPLLAGIFSGTLFWCVVVWIFKILPKLFFHNFFENLILGGVAWACAWSFFKAMFMNPGVVPVPTDNHVVLEDIKELVKSRRFDSEHFCVYSFIRKPLRSRYSNDRKALIAKFDHYCPWTYNEVGVRNHKVFMIFIYTLNLAVLLFLQLSLELFENGRKKSGYESDEEDNSCPILSNDLCEGYKNHHFHFNLLFFCLFNYIWLLFLCLSQTFQILKGLTTWEFTRLTSRHTRLPDSVTFGSTPSNHKRPDVCLCAKLVGLDQFLITAKVAVLSLFNSSSVEQHQPLRSLDLPTDYGYKTNFLDFWFLGEIEWRNLFFLPIEGEGNLNRQLTDYYRLWEYPSKGPLEV
ncbi:Piso0_005687 [Millerozyma farinosa CBS 7064]|uniref:Palmitoyltransferase n=1 Tax=Pichia sorbitophila (strain ATCC MYA-4447 / BCRC 22081 / CBS 7064 / NBRC 10061 / NRRL Y-12695) TaxID=559304 RepID=G8Y2N1_PICSO|nr:Piso0_005687 [Millerozyma farinosa CBS 7064]